MGKYIETIFAKNFATNYEKKNNTWNIRRLVDESFVPATKQTRVLTYKSLYIEDFWISRGHVDQLSMKMLPTWIH